MGEPLEISLIGPPQIAVNHPRDERHLTLTRIPLQRRPCQQGWSCTMADRAAPIQSLSPAAQTPQATIIDSLTTLFWINVNTLKRQALSLGRCSILEFEVFVQPWLRFTIVDDYQ